MTPEEIDAIFRKYGVSTSFSWQYGAALREALKELGARLDKKKDKDKDEE